MYRSSSITNATRAKELKSKQIKKILDLQRRHKEEAAKLSKHYKYIEELEKSTLVKAPQGLEHEREAYIRAYFKREEIAKE